MAVAAEKSARDFYTSLSEKFPDHAALFEQLAKDEKNHVETFTRLLSRPEVYSTEEERIQADYNIQVLEDSKIIGNLRKGADRARGISDLKSAIEAAVQLEKDTALFYSNMAMGLGSEDRQEVYKIMHVEYAHLYKVRHIIL